ncbi:MAG: SulP family inorganic anion transporter, partial [Proteobacteria bacterium]|nr:SulP family inorganic anion transporter [Pseudomonadota bacterium]
IMTGFATTLPPLLAGPRNPAVAVMSVLAATVAATAASKGLSHAEAARHVLIGLAAASMLTGALTWALGRFGLGQIVRFVPYPVVAGFLAASGVLLLLGGVRVATGFGAATDIASLANGGALLRLALAAAFLGLVMALKRTGLGARALPAVIIMSALLLDLILYLAGVDQRSGWHLDAGAGAVAWSPLASLATVDWSVLRSAVVEIASIAGVSTAALLLDISSLEVQRRTEADVDAEFMANGAANLAVSMIGGLSVGPALNTSRLVDDLGGRGRLAGIAAGTFVVAVLALGVDFSHLVPRPILGGLLLFMGTGVLMESLKVPGTRSWLEFALTLAIMAAIIGLGYLTGLVLGLIGACLLFAARYSRIDVVRRHLTRREISAPIERPHEVADLLKAEG